MPIKPRETPIERIFRKVMGQSGPLTRIERGLPKRDGLSRWDIAMGERESCGGSASFLGQEKKKTGESCRPQNNQITHFPFVRLSSPRLTAI
jgi:hypothetical protein